ncbi:hypothetical protein PpBr36_08834 [Pyricularia pennisetigena]|uniref:hypothetical protein n=1 Tax=Pyricularia pennisetigena TaxID=1578925 RepID=UPI00114E3EC2|nr:hypothetical protein PpBr36_08834 [Pyricularia pennisetigena]TLS24778.1 hypothetical protein PpBr36_08834 [Pyricularia pennisetigena]
MTMPAPRRRFVRLLLPVAAIFFVLYQAFFRLSSAGSDHGPILTQVPPPRAGSIEFVPSGFDWATGFRPYYPRPPADQARLPPASARRPIPRVQHAFETDPPRGDLPVQEARQKAVRDAFKKSWDSYDKHAWTHDELRPLTGGGKDTFGGFGATLVDALDTLWIMGLKQEFVDAARVACRLDFSPTAITKRAGSLNVFETTIRFLGGLISAHDLSGEPALLQKAVELGDMLLAAFDTPTRIPGFWLNFHDAANGRQHAGSGDPAASPASLSLEFTRLAQLTNNHKYYDAIDVISNMLYKTQNQTLLPGMWPVLLNFQSWETAGVQSHHEFGLGALADSLYEYLPKMHALLAGSDPKYEAMYRVAMDVVEKHVLFRPMAPPNGSGAGQGTVPDILFSGTATVHEDGSVTNNNEGQHLACFTGGMFALGGRLFDNPHHQKIGEQLARGCAWGYASFPTGLLPEMFGTSVCPTIDKPCAWDEARWTRELQPPWEKPKVNGNGAVHGSEKTKLLPRGFTHARDARYILRPEAIESLFVLYRITGQDELRNIAWRMFLDIQVATSTPLANAAINDVTETGKVKQIDSMESFWLAETLKYFYLIFSDPNVISLDDWVLNTEAHPFRRPKTRDLSKT